MQMALMLYLRTLPTKRNQSRQVKMVRKSKICQKIYVQKKKKKLLVTGALPLKG